MMTRDFKFLKRKQKAEEEEEEIENVPVNLDPDDRSSLSSMSQTSVDLSSRLPLNSIPRREVPNPRPEHGPRSKFDRTPTKPKPKPSEPALPLRTPERHVTAKGRFGWAQRNIEEASFSHLTPRSTTSTRVTGKAISEANSTQSTPTKSVVSKPSVGRGGGGGRGGNGAAGGGGGGLAALYRGFPVSNGGGPGGSAVNTVEVPHFELREDPSFWMDHNVQVVIRVRPLNSIERSMHGYNRCLKQESSQSITWLGQPETRFTFDHVACESIDQETLFRMAGLPMVENCLSGYNSCIFAYGQTGSGKTYTMLGEIDTVEQKPSTDRGMTPRIFEFLFARIQAEEETRRDERLEYNCKCSFLEIYNEQITDLLDPSSSNLLLREDVKKGVYVENLLECEVHSVSDILKLLTQGSLNRKVAATNMNRESSRSHSVFTCVIESRWEKDSTTNLRFARLNLVDLAGSERQKSSGAEGERLKEAANINKSLSTLGHVIMILVDVAHGKQRHVPYRDSRLTFLLQDSLGGNSKTMIVANVSPSICCAAETLNTLKFAQRAKLIQNNAVVNEDSTGDVLALQHQIRLLKEELSALKRQNVFRPLSFGSDAKATIQEQDNTCTTNNFGMDDKELDSVLGFESKGSFRLSTKQLKSLETTLAGALRREQMSEACIKKLEAEIEQLNRLVRQREEDTQSTKMMLRFREDKIHRMELLLAGSLPSDSYLLEDNRALLEEIQLLRAKVDKNPEVTRFALENIRLLDQLRRFQELYEEGEREILLDEVSNLREQLLQSLDSKSLQHSHSNLDHDSQEHFCAWKQGNPYHSEPNNVLNELEDCRRKLNSCLEENEKLRREVQHLHSTVENLKFPAHKTDCNINITKDSMKAPYSENRLINEDEGNLKSMNHTSVFNVTEEMLDLQLEVDILKIIIKEERSTRAEVEGRAFWLNRNLELAESKLLSIRKECEDATHELKEAKTVIAALESQQILAIEEMEDLRKNNSHYLKLLSEKDLEVMNLKEHMSVHEFRCQPPNNQDSEGSTLQRKFKRMQDSLDKAKRLNTWYQNDHAFLVSNEEEMDKVRQQVEAETAEVIVCMQEELLSLQQQVQNFNLKEIETNRAMLLLETQLNELQEKLSHLDEDNQRLHGKLQEKDMELRTSSEQWQLLTSEMEEVLSGGQCALEDASEQLSQISSSISERRIWISEKVGRLTRQICEKDLLIEELRRCLEDANTKKNDLEFMLQSLRGAALVISEAHQQECSEKEKETALLRSQLKEKVSDVVKLERRIELAEREAAKASTCATAAFVIVNHLSEVNFHFVSELRSRDVQLNESAAISLRREASLLDQAASLKEAEEVIQSLRLELVEQKATCATLQQKLSEEEEHACSLEQMLEDIEENNLTRTREKLAELNAAILSLRSCIGVEVDPDRSSPTDRTQGAYKPVDRWTDGGEDLRTNIIKRSCVYLSDQKIMKFRCCSSDAYSRVDDFIFMNKEIEYALKNLQEAQVEITRRHAEKEQTLISGIQYQECIQSFANQLITLQAAIGNFERQFESKMQTIDLKLLSFEQTLHEASTLRCQTNEFFELEIGDAKVYAAQKAAEASCVYAKFEEAQDTLKEADIVLNELMIANGKMMLDLERLERSESRLVKEREMLIGEIQRLQSINDLKDQHIQDLEDQYGSELMQTGDVVMELEVLVSHVQMSYEESIKSMECDIHDLEAVILGCGELVQSWLEDIWSGIIVKDCAVSVMHLCHVGILLETVTGLNAENGLLHRGLCDSDSVIADLRKHNSKASKELQMFRTLQGKLLVDIRSGFDRILRKEEEAGELGNKLATFEKKIVDLRLQEESMFQRANHMGSQLALLMEELHLSNSNFSDSLSMQDSMLKNREEVLNSQAELLVKEIQAKDVQLCIMESQLKEVDLQRAASEREHRYFCSLVEKLKTELIASMVDTEMKEQLLLAEEADITLQQREVEEAHRGTEKFLGMLTECKLRLSQMVEENKDLEREIELLKDVAQSNDALRVELADSVETKARLTDQIHALEAEKGRLREELLINSAKLEEFGCQKNVIEQECMRSRALVENLKKKLILMLVESGLQEQLLLAEERKAGILQKEVQEAHRQSHILLLSLKHSSKLGNREIDEAVGGCLLRGILPLRDAAKTSDELKVELCKLLETKERLFSRVEELEGECEILLNELKTKEIASVAVDQQKKQFDADISSREIVLTNLQKELDTKEFELSRMSYVEEENMRLKGEVGKLKDDNILILQELERKNVDIELSLKRNHDMEVENCRMQERILSLETAISSLQSHLEMKNSHSVLVEDLCSKRQYVEEDFGILNTLEVENVTLREELESFKKNMQEVLTRLALTTLKSINLLENASSKGQFLVEIFENEGFKVVENLFHDICGNDNKISEFMKVIESLECQMKDLMSYDLNLNAELLRKDDILKGLLFDLSLLQESASIDKDQKDKVEEMMASFGALEEELLVKSAELDESVAHIQMLEGQLQEKMDILSTLESNYMKEHESLSNSSAENLELRSQIEEVLGAKFSLEEELTEKRSLIEHLEMGHSQMENDVHKMSDTIECLRDELSDLAVERDQLYIEINSMKEELEKAKALADENEAIAVEARQIAESTKIYGDEKEAEVKLLERSIEELECTINVLENKVDILKEEAERQRLHREELEMELHVVNRQMLNVNGAETNIKRYLDTKEIELEEAEKHIKYLETDMAEKDKEIYKCKAHISELILNAEAQAREYKQKFKELEAMAEQVKPEGYALPHIVNSSLNKSEKTTVKPRGSGSPFKCIGLGLTQQMKSEKDEELTAARFRIEELESQVACRQKEIFALNSRLATAESMTHDVIRDLLGVKLDMTNYMSLLDNKQVHKIAEKVQLSSLESQVPEAEIMKLKQQLNEFVKERTGWLEEIDRKRAEMVSAHVAFEKLRQREQLLTAEIEVLKMENANHKKRVVELEGEVEKLSGQQNLQHRIHHHAKIKEENNVLKLQNEELRAKLRRAEVMSTRVKEELGYYRASVGKSSCTEFNDEQRLMNKLKELEDDRMQIAQKLLAMCTSILKVAGITKPRPDINPIVAEEALEHIKERITSLERELQDLMLKNRICNERIRLLELMPQASPMNSRTDENYSTPRRAQASFLSDFER